MIASLKGRIVSKSPSVVVQIGGIGLELLVPSRDMEIIEEGTDGVLFHTYFYVREDKLVLYGFLRRQDRDLFARLIEVTGVGPKLALGVLSVDSAEKVGKAIRNADMGKLTSIPGLGRKTAERLVMELREKLEELEIPDEEARVEEGVREEVLLALTSLGLGRAAAEDALSRLDWEKLLGADVEVVVKEALKLVAGS